MLRESGAWQLKRSDCSRNAAREILAAVGWDDETDCLRSFWSCMTMVKMMKKDDYLLGSEHLDYGPVPNPPLGLDKLADINAYQKKCLQDDLPIFKKAVETLIAHVDALCLSDWSAALCFSWQNSTQRWTMSVRY